MSGSWAGKIKSAIEGLVDGADARARLASAASLEALRRQLADRRLEAELENMAEPWRVPFVLAPVAAPFWLAEGFVTLAQSFSQAEAEAHADRPAMMSSLTRGQMLALLEPVDVLQGDISGLLADPNRRPALPLPLMARPFAQTNAGLLSERVPPAYARGLLAGAASLVAATQVLVNDYTGFLEHASAPAWIRAGCAAIKGDLAAAQTRFDAVQLRAAPVVRQQPPDESALRNLVVDLWDLTNSYLKVGQLVSSPKLMPGAQPLPGEVAPVARAQATPIQVSAPPNPGVTAAAAPAAPVPAAQPAPKAPPPIAGMPDIGGAPSSPAAAIPASQPAPKAPPPIAAIPDIGGTPPSPAAPAPAARVPDSTSRPAVMPEIGTRPAQTGVPGPAAPAARTPEIGGGPPRSAPPTAPGPVGVPPRMPDAGRGPAEVRMPETTTRSMPAIGSSAGPPTQPSPPPVKPAAPASEPVRGLPRIGGQADAPAAPQRVVAGDPGPSGSPAPKPSAGAQSSAPGRRVERKDRWLAGAQGARYRLRAAGQEDQAEAELAAFWEARQWSLTPDETRYLDQVSQYVKSGAVALTGRSQAECPYAPIYRVGPAAVQVLDRPLRPGMLFSYDFRAGGQGLQLDLPPRAGVQDAS